MKKESNSECEVPIDRSASEVRQGLLGMGKVIVRWIGKEEEPRRRGGYVFEADGVTVLIDGLQHARTALRALEAV